MNKIKEQHEFQMLGFLGIFKESFKLIFTYPKIFFLITLFSILPRSCFLFVENYWFSIYHLSNTLTLDIKQPSSCWYKDVVGSTISNIVESIIYEVVNTNLLIQAACLIFPIICSLVSASTIVYTISCIYNDDYEEITFKKVIKVVPKVWNPYMITSQRRFGLIMLAAEWSFIMWVFTLHVITYSNKRRMIILVIGALCYVMGLCYMSIICQLSGAISIIEKFYGFEALKRSRALIKGKTTGTALAIFLAGILSSLPILVVIHNEIRLIDGNYCNNGAGVMAENYQKIVVVLWSSFVNLFFLVNQVVFYFVCKSYHHEDIIEEYQNIGGYVSLKGETI